MNAITDQPFLVGESTWVPVRDGNLTASAVYDRHYSRNPKSRGHARIAGPGEKMVLLTPCCRALFVWRKFISKDQQDGVNCAIFRNEGAGRSSDLIRAAMTLGWARWPGARFYTYVNPRRVLSANPGFCFLKAGWRRCGITKTRRLLVLEVTP
jgi:hypothetical protein